MIYMTMFSFVLAVFCVGAVVEHLAHVRRVIRAISALCQRAAIRPVGRGQP